jgi:hypothetical protein
MKTTNTGGMPPLGESGCVGVAARAIITPALLREGDMEDKVTGEGKSQGMCSILALTLGIQRETFELTPFR